MDETKPKTEKTGSYVKQDTIDVTTASAVL
jgi:hypothetical protein